MKYKVIGWTFSDNYDIENVPLTFAARHAIVDAIRENNYLFSGFDHQEAWYGCAVLNDGKKRACSQRGFAGIMAEAHGETEPYSYSKYMFAIKEKAKIKPKAIINKQEIVATSSLRETYTLEVSKKVYSTVLKEGFIILQDLAELRYIDSSDSIVIKNDDDIKTCEVLSVNRYRNISNLKDLKMFDLNQNEFEGKTLLEIKLKIINN